MFLLDNCCLCHTLLMYWQTNFFPFFEGSSKIFCGRRLSKGTHSRVNNNVICYCIEVIDKTVNVGLRQITFLCLNATRPEKSKTAKQRIYFSFKFISKILVYFCKDTRYKGFIQVNIVFLHDKRMNTKYSIIQHF